MARGKFKKPGPHDDASMEGEPIDGPVDDEWRRRVNQMMADGTIPSTIKPVTEKGGSGSGNFGHQGRPGETGGSAAGYGSPDATMASRLDKIQAEEAKQALAKAIYDMTQKRVQLELGGKAAGAKGTWYIFTTPDNRRGYVYYNKLTKKYEVPARSSIPGEIKADLDLQAANKSAPKTAKGDKAGHQFRGNQFSQSAKPAASDEDGEDVDDKKYHRKKRDAIAKLKFQLAEANRTRNARKAARIRARIKLLTDNSE